MDIADQSAKVSQTWLEGAPAAQVNRRRFLKGAGITGAAMVGGPSLLQILTSCGGGTVSHPDSAAAPNLSKGGQLTLLAGESFVKNGDVILQGLCDDWASQHKGWKVTYQTINSADMITKVPAEIQAQSGADLLAFSNNQAWLYSSSCVDVSRAVHNILKASGQPKFYEAIEAYNNINGTWRAIPWDYGTEIWIYRKDLWGKVGKPDFVTSYSDLLTYGKQVLAKTKIPIGLALGHSTGDATDAWYPVLWAFGGQEVDKDGKTVVLDSSETRAAVEYAIELWNSGVLFHDVISWTDSGNNLAWAAEQISATENSSSVYVDALPGGSAPNALLAANSIGHGPLAGPKATASLMATTSWGVMKWSSNPGAAMELIEYMMQPKRYEKWLATQAGAVAYPNSALDDSSVWKNPALAGFSKVSSSRWPGWPGPPHRAASEAVAQFTIINMFANAVQNPGSVKQIISQAASQLQSFYSAAN